MKLDTILKRLHKYGYVPMNFSANSHDIDEDKILLCHIQLWLMKQGIEVVASKMTMDFKTGERHLRIPYKGCYSAKIFNCINAGKAIFIDFLHNPINEKADYYEALQFGIQHALTHLKMAEISGKKFR